MPSVQRVKWAQFRVLMVTLAALAILAVLLYLLTGSALFTPKVYLYVYLPDATGLSSASPVRVDGVTVGKVAAVSLSGSKDPKRVVRVTLVVDHRTLDAIPPGSFAQLSFEDPVGNKYVDITSAGTGTRLPDTGIPYREQTDFLKSLDLAQFEQRLREVDAVLSDIEAGRGRVGELVLGTQLYSDLRRRFGQIERDVRAAASTSSQVGEALYSDRVYRKMTEPLVQLDQSLAALQSGQGAGIYLRDSAQYDQLRAAVADLGATVAGFRNNPLMQSDTLYRDWTNGVTAMIRSVDALSLNPMFSTSEPYENLNGFAREMRDNIRDFREDPAKFLRLKLF
jgi:phospholipid/cholesterol/gamma-HCH transport system substrate-binding protein